MKKLDIENVFLDLDGTTLKSDKTISISTIETLKKLKLKNINVFIATGRPPYMIKKELTNLPVNKNVICVNGGMIIDSKSNQTLYQEKIDLPSLLKIENFLKNNQYPYLIYTNELMYYNSDDSNEWIISLKSTIANLNDEYKWKLIKVDNDFTLENHHVIKLLVPTINLKEELISNLMHFFETEIICFKILQSQKNILDIIPFNSSKGNGIRYITKLLSLNILKTLAFGDADNDIPMFEAVRYSVAMDNAVVDLKKIATYITDSNDDEGIANFIDQNVL